MRIGWQGEGTYVGSRDNETDGGGVGESSVREDGGRVYRGAREVNTMNG